MNAPPAPPLHIVHTESSCGWGGQELRILAEARGMIRRGHRVTLIAPVAARIFAEASRFRVPVTALPIEKKRLGGVGAIRDWLMAHPADVVNTHSSTDSWLVALAWASLRNAPPIVRTRHISAPVPDNMASRWLYRSASRFVITTGESLREQLVARLRLDPARVLSIPTGIDTQTFRPPTARERVVARHTIGASEDALVIGIVATLRSWKGHRYLIEGFAEALRPQIASVADARAMTLVIVGDGPQREALEALVDQFAIRAHVRFAGNQPNVIPWLHAMDLFTLPSYANEGVPQAILQAMACGIPVITTDAGAIGEVAYGSVNEADENDTACIVGKEDAAGLRDAIVALGGDAERRERMSRNALAIVRERHGIEGMLDRMEVVFRRAANRSTEPKELR